MASPCLSGGGGGRAYGFDLEIAVKSTSFVASSSSSSSPSSTLSESGNSPLAISTRRKPRTPRKRPNQTYNEAAALLSTAYPKIFSANHLPAAIPSTTSPLRSFPFDSPELLLLPAAPAGGDCGFLPVRDKTAKDPKFSAAAAAEVSSRDNSCQTSSVDWSSKEFCGGGGGYEDEDDFDAESILDEEIEQGGIDSIMGNLSVISNEDLVNGNAGNHHHHHHHHHQATSFVYGYPPGFNGRNFQQWIGGGSTGITAFRRVDDWWSYPVVDVFQISPRLDSTYRPPPPLPMTARVLECGGKAMVKQSNNKKKKKVEKLAGDELKEGGDDFKGKKGGLQLKLNYEEVLKAWSGKESPLPPAEGGGGLRDDEIDVTASLSSLLPPPTAGRIRKKK